MTPRNERIAEIVNEHFDFVWRLLRRLGFESSAADDAAQDVFVVAMNRVEVITRGHERTFLYGTTLRVAANARRRIRRQREVPQEMLSDRRADGALPDAQTERGRACALLDHILAELPPELARVLVLSEIEGLDGAEISALEGIPVGTVASRLRRARERLRKKLARFEAGMRLGEGIP
ncbi:MAG TPA: sigma-70 family RNA polymerase sigma factor [Polyangiaceae bacterium]|jgi:RNA polymerase sigma-70 factor (ECF subfamily)